MGCSQAQPSPNSGSSHISASAAILGLKPPWVRNLPLQERGKKSTTNGCSLKTLYFLLRPSWFKRPLIIMAAKAGSLLRQWEAQNNSFKSLELVIGIKTVESQEITKKKKAMTLRVWSARATRPDQAWTFLFPISTELQHSQKGNFGGEKTAPGAASSKWKFGRGSWGVELGLSCSPAALQELRQPPSASWRDRESCDLKGNRKQQLLF